MRCTRVERLVERYVDGILGNALAREVEAHAGGCVRCTARITAARMLVVGFEAEPTVRAPRGFSQRVMEAVYREALTGRPGPTHAAEQRPPRMAARAYRRLGLSFVLTAGVLAVSLLIPRAAYPSLLGTGSAAAGFAGGSAGLVRSALNGADDAVRGILRK